jgi:Fic family protein
LAIHPFQDGNGRLSRILTTLLLLQNGYQYVPYSSLENIIENNKESYYLALRRTQQTLKNANPDFTPWLQFFLRSLQKQKLHLETKIAREKLIIADLPAAATEIITIIREHGNITSEHLEKITKINRNTLKKYLASLVKKGHIVRLGKGRATYYTL